MSITFAAVSKNVGTDALEPVFDYTETSPELVADGFDDDGYPNTTPNPLYRPELDINLSTQNASEVMAVLGVPKTNGQYLIDIHTIKTRVDQWLEANKDRQLGGYDEFKGYVDGIVIQHHDSLVNDLAKALGGMTVFNQSRPDGYFNTTMARLQVFINEALKAGATHISGD